MITVAINDAESDPGVPAGLGLLHATTNNGTKKIAITKKSENSCPDDREYLEECMQVQKFDFGFTFKKPSRMPE